MQATIQGVLRKGIAGSAAILIAGASMALSTAPTLAKGHSDGGSGSAQSNHSGSGDSNRGDVWTDNVGQPSGPGHEQDTHLACTNINLWGAGMGDSSGTYVIDSWPPSGNQAVVYNSTWTYNQAQGGAQVISVINVQTLVANAQAAGATPVNKNGYHFKLDLSQDPQKHKTFWVSCPAPAGTVAGGHEKDTKAGDTQKDHESKVDTDTPADTQEANESTVDTDTDTKATDTDTDTRATDIEATDVALAGGALGVSTGGSTVTPVAPAFGVEGVSTGNHGVAGAHAVAPGAAPTQGVLGASTTMPVTGRAAIGGALVLAMVLMVGGFVLTRRARTA
ncbi:MAG: hypothetical protein ABR598_07600 [Candidatus Dormibacteria bacterium]